MSGELLEVASLLARGAGEILRKYYSGTTTISSKSTLIDLVTDADKAAEAHVLGEVERRFPDHAVWGEESGRGATEGPYRWIVDPLDGTVNFAHRQPHFSVLIAVQERKGNDYETIAGVTFDPLRDELFTARRGAGAALNGEAIQVSATSRLIDSSLVTGFSYDRLFDLDDNHREFCQMNLLSQGVRRLGSAGLDLAYVACGRFDGFWEYKLSPWDLASGVLLIEEAGGRVTNTVGGPAELEVGALAGSNGVLHDALVAALASARALPIGSREGLAEFLPPEIASKLGESSGR